MKKVIRTLSLFLVVGLILSGITPLDCKAKKKVEYRKVRERNYNVRLKKDGSGKEVEVDQLATDFKTTYNSNKEITKYEAKYYDNQSGELVSETYTKYYYKKGRYYKCVNSDGSYSVSQYGKDGRQTGMKNYTKTGKLYSITTYSYYKNGRFKQFVTKKGKTIIHKRVFYSNGCAKSEQDYFEDGTLRQEEVLDKYGNHTSYIRNEKDSQGTPYVVEKVTNQNIYNKNHVMIEREAEHYMDQGGEKQSWLLHVYCYESGALAGKPYAESIAYYRNGDYEALRPFKRYEYSVDKNGNITEERGYWVGNNAGFFKRKNQWKAF